MADGSEFLNVSQRARVFNQFTLRGLLFSSPRKPSGNVDNDSCCGIGGQCLSIAEKKAKAMEGRKKKEHSWERGDRIAYSTTPRKSSLSLRADERIVQEQEVSNSLLALMAICVTEQALANERDRSKL